MAKSNGPSLTDDAILYQINFPLDTPHTPPANHSIQPHHTTHKPGRRLLGLGTGIGAGKGLLYVSIVADDRTAVERTCARVCARLEGISERRLKAFAFGSRGQVRVETHVTSRAPALDRFDLDRPTSIHTETGRSHQCDQVPTHDVWSSTSPAHPIHPQAGKQASMAMARLLLPPLLLLLALFLTQRGVDGLHADRAGKEDWMRRHVGRVINAVPAVSVCACVCVYVSTHR